MTIYEQSNNIEEELSQGRDKLKHLNLKAKAFASRYRQVLSYKQTLEKLHQTLKGANEFIRIINLPPEIKLSEKRRKAGRVLSWLGGGAFAVIGLLILYHQLCYVSRIEGVVQGVPAKVESPTSGVIKVVLGEKGQSIRSGQVLFEIQDEGQPGVGNFNYIASPAFGFIHSIDRVVGDRVKTGDIVATIATLETSGFPWVLTQVNASDAKRIHYGDHAEIYFPKLNLKVRGTVFSMEFVHRQRPENQSEAAVMPIDKIPIQIVLNQIPSTLDNDMRALVKIETRFYVPLLTLLEFIKEKCFPETVQKDS